MPDKSEIRSIAVFCGSSLGSETEFESSARALGKILAENKITLVYGGANVGLMGTVANAVLGYGGKAIGILPRFLENKEIAHKGLTELILVDSMHQRKMKMFEISQGFIALPGGFGTLEEVTEILTWQQLGLHQYPVVFLNIQGFYNHLKSFFEEMESKGLLKPSNRKMAIFTEEVTRVLETMKSYQAPEMAKWITEKGV